MRLFMLALAAATVSTSLAQSAFKMLYVPNNTSGTVAAMRVNPDGTLVLQGTYSAGPNPYDCVLTRDGRKLVVVNASSLTSEPVYAFDVQANGGLIQSGAPLIVGDGTLSVAMGRDRFPILTEATQDDLLSLELLGTGGLAVVNAANAGAFPVKVVTNTAGDRAFVAGTSGNAYIYQYTISPTGTVAFLNSNATAVGTGQGLATHPTLPIVYLSTGLGNLIFWYDYSGGSLAFVNSVANGGNSCVDMAVHPSGRWLYVCNVVSDTLTVHPIDANGNLGGSMASYSIGNDIRDVVADDRFVYVTDESSLGGLGPGVQVYRVEPSGFLTQIMFPVNTGGTRPSHMALWAPASEFGPNGYQVLEGTYFGGGVPELQLSDDQKLRVISDEFDSNTSIDFWGTSSVLAAEYLQFTLEANATRADLGITISYYNYQTNSFALIAQRTSSLLDQTYVIDSPPMPGRFVNTSSGEVRAKVRWIPFSDVDAADGWGEAVDKVRWRVAM